MANYQGGNSKGWEPLESRGFGFTFLALQIGRLMSWDSPHPQWPMKHKLECDIASCPTGNTGKHTCTRSEEAAEKVTVTAGHGENSSDGPMTHSESQSVNCSINHNQSHSTECHSSPAHQRQAPSITRTQHILSIRCRLCLGGRYVQKPEVPATPSTT